ncbi:hypothetical protein [Providencia sp. T47]|uniref:hypothetical protein n=1 Tax=Providencia sp. T47 TaxID=3395376 RepID=UPI0039BC4027
MTNTINSSTNELYLMQRSPDGKFASGKRIEQPDIPMGFYVSHNTLVMNYYNDSSDKIISVMGEMEKEKFHSLVQRVTMDFDRAMFSSKFDNWYELTTNSFNAIKMNNSSLEAKIKEFPYSPVSELDNLTSCVDLQCQLSIISLLSHYKYDPKYFSRCSELFQYIENLTNSLKNLISSFLISTNEEHKNTRDNVIFSKLFYMLKNNEISNSQIKKFESITGIDSYQLLSKISNEVQYYTPCHGFRAVRSINNVENEEYRYSYSFYSKYKQISNSEILDILCSLFERAKSIQSLQDYLMHDLPSNFNDVINFDIVDSMLKGPVSDFKLDVQQ